MKFRILASILCSCCLLQGVYADVATLMDELRSGDRSVEGSLEFYTCRTEKPLRITIPIFAKASELVGLEASQATGLVAADRAQFDIDEPLGFSDESSFSLKGIPGHALARELEPLVSNLIEWAQDDGARFLIGRWLSQHSDFSAANASNLGPELETALQLCPDTSVTFRSSPRLHEGRPVARGIAPIDDLDPVSEQSNASTVLLYDASGKPIAYQNIGTLRTKPLWTAIVEDDPQIRAEYGSPKIVGGSKVEDGQMEWSVSFSTLQGERYENFCGGTLLDPYWVLTAAHCAITSESTILIGRTNLNPASNERQGEKNSPLRVWRHIGFDNQGHFEADIALVRLKDPVSGYDTPHTWEEPLRAGDFVTSVGWGATHYGGSMVEDLQSVDLEIHANTYCHAQYENFDERMFCASKPGKDACQGDSGSGAFQQNRYGQLNLVGIVSFGYGCAFEQFPGVYTDVVSYREWIDKVREVDEL
ncbi:MAG: trypsin-like serine protease [Pseudomonadales bacterium]|nr:trypsin-like serine protease [Pseudomonadales bacterium]